MNYSLSTAPILNVAAIQTRIEPLRQALLEHPVYEEMRDLGHLRLFMQHHVFAVWDFMSLLKAMQRQITCVEVPWIPAQDAASARLINDIVLAEETDEDGQGGFASHYELYHRAMRACGASTSMIDGFLEQLRAGQTFADALQTVQAPSGVRQFVEQSFAVIQAGSLPALAAAFTFGREDLLPDVFQRIVDELGRQEGDALEPFQYYLSRHIELDGDEHGPMATRLVEMLCGESEAAWQAAADAAEAALQARLAMWDGMLQAFQSAER